MVFAAGTNDKFAQSARRISGAIGVLRGETFIVMVVAVDNEFGVRFVERLEEWLHGEVVAMGASRTKERLVPVGERAGGGMRGKIGAQPLFLRGTGFATAAILAFTVQHNDVPRSQLVAIKAGLCIAGGGAKKVKIRRRAGSNKVRVG